MSYITLNSIFIDEQMAQNGANQLTRILNFLY